MTHPYRYTFFHILFHYGLSRDIEYSALRGTVGPYCLFILYIIVTAFVFLGCKITADGDDSHEIKRHLLFGRKAMTNVDSILKSRDITLLTNAHIVKAMVFLVVMYGCESWTIKITEH